MQYFFIESSSSLDKAAGVVSDYINFCVNTNVPTKAIKYFLNNKPCINKDIRSKIIQKNNIKSSKDRLQLKIHQDELNTEWLKLQPAMVPY